MRDPNHYKMPDRGCEWYPTCLGNDKYSECVIEGECIRQRGVKVCRKYIEMTFLKHSIPLNGLGKYRAEIHKAKMVKTFRPVLGKLGEK